MIFGMAKSKRGFQLGFLGFLAAFVVLVTSLFILQHQTNMFARAGDGQLELSAEVVDDNFVLSWVAIPGTTRYVIYRDSRPYFRLTSDKIIAKVTGNTYTETIPAEIGTDDLRLSYYAVLPDKVKNISLVKPRYAGMVVWNLTYSNPNIRYQVNLSMPLEQKETNLKDVVGLRLYGTENPETADAVLEFEQGQFRSAWLCDGDVCKSWGEDYYQRWLSNDYSPSDMTLPVNKALQLNRRSGQQNIKRLALAGLLPIVPGGWTVPSLTGSYFVTIPVWRTEVTKASMIVKLFPQISEVSRWNRATQTYQTYKVGGVDYTVRPGEAIFVKVQ